MKKCIFLLLVVTSLAMALPAHAAKPVVIMGPGLNSGRTAYHQNWNRTLSADTLYTLTGHYNVDSLFSLTIQPGTVIRGDTAAVLLIQRGAKIWASGTPQKPIVFTSLKAPGLRDRGDWGGVIFLGKARVNKYEPLIEGGIIKGSYGGHDDCDNSGIFKYVRLEFPGYRFQLNNEVNGLTMGGVGAGTEIHHVQVSYSFDDSYEWFGGSVNVHHLVAFGGTDDEFDTDFGYHGCGQFMFALRDPFYWDPTGQSNGFESDNDASSTSTDEPHTNCHFVNCTMIGPARVDSIQTNMPPGHTFEYSAVLRRSTMHCFYNSVIAGYPWGISLRDATTQGFANADTLQIRCSSIASWRTPTGSASVHDHGRWANVETWFNTPAYNNLGSAPRNISTLMFTDLSNLNNPNPIPLPGSELATAPVWDVNLWQNCPCNSSLVPTNYRGAFDPAKPGMENQWTYYWTNFDPQNTDYTNGLPTGTDSPTPALMMLQNYPNPFNPSTTIKFSVPVSGHVTLKVFNVQGQEVATIVNSNLSKGDHTVSFSAAGLQSGVYFYRLTGKGFNETRKMLILR